MSKNTDFVNDKNLNQDTVEKYIHGFVSDKLSSVLSDFDDKDNLIKSITGSFLKTALSMLGLQSKGDKLEEEGRDLRDQLRDAREKKNRISFYKSLNSECDFNKRIISLMKQIRKNDLAKSQYFGGKSKEQLDNEIYLKYKMKYIEEEIERINKEVESFKHEIRMLQIEADRLRKSIKLRQASIIAYQNQLVDELSGLADKLEVNGKKFFEGNTPEQASGFIKDYFQVLEKQSKMLAELTFLHHKSLAEDSKSQNKNHGSPILTGSALGKRHTDYKRKIDDLNINIELEKNGLLAKWGIQGTIQAFESIHEVKVRKEPYQEFSFEQNYEIFKETDLLKKAENIIHQAHTNNYESPIDSSFPTITNTRQLCMNFAKECLLSNLENQSELEIKAEEKVSRSIDNASLESITEDNEISQEEIENNNEMESLLSSLGMDLDENDFLEEPPVSIKIGR